MPDRGLQLRRAISIQAEGKELLEKNAIAPAAARLCYVAADASACNLTTPQGTVIDDLLVYRFAEDHLFLVVNAGTTEKEALTSIELLAALILPQTHFLLCNLPVF